MHIYFATGFELTAAGWESLAKKLRSEPIRQLEDIIDFLEQNGHAKHAWNQFTKGLAIDWQSDDAVYYSRLGDFDASKFRWLSFRVGQNYGKNGHPNLNELEKEQSFSILLQDRTGQQKKVQLTEAEEAITFPWLDQSTFKTTLRTVLVPLNLFSNPSSGVDLQHLTELRILFDQVAMGSIVIDNIAFTH